jgi:hypothetical protein
VHLAFDIFQGIGIAAAAGIRPFLPGLVAGLLSLAKFQVHFDHSKFDFLQKAPFLVAVGVLAVLLVAVEASKRGADVDTGPGSWLSAACGAAVGALVFAGVLCHGGHTWWPGLIAGVLCAGVGYVAVRPFLVRLRSRLDPEAASLGVPLIGESAALGVAALSGLLPPAGVVLPVGLVVLWYLGRGRGDEKYAGLRILR